MTVRIRSCGASSVWSRTLPGNIHDSVCQIKVILSPPEVIQLLLHHKREAARWLILSHNGSCDKWVLILRAVVCCCRVMSWPLAFVSGAFSCQPSGAALQLHTRVPLKMHTIPLSCAQTQTDDFFACYESNQDGHVDQHRHRQHRNPLSLLNGSTPASGQGLMKATCVGHWGACLFDFHTCIKAK